MVISIGYGNIAVPKLITETCEHDDIAKKKSDNKQSSHWSDQLQTH